MKWFGRTGGYWMFWTGAIYLAIGIPCAVYFKEVDPALVQLAWLISLSAPFWCPPFGRYLNMSVDWDIKMFDWFKSREERKAEYDNVVKFPEPKAVPYVEPPPEPEKPVTTYYRLGITNNSRVSFQMGYSEITMNADGINNMIKQLECFRDQVMEYEDHGDAE